MQSRCDLGSGGGFSSPASRIGGQKDFMKSGGGSVRLGKTANVRISAAVGDWGKLCGKAEATTRRLTDGLVAAKI